MGQGSLFHSILWSLAHGGQFWSWGIRAQESATYANSLSGSDAGGVGPHFDRQCFKAVAETLGRHSAEPLACALSRTQAGRWD